MRMHAYTYTYMHLTNKKINLNIAPLSRSPRRGTWHEDSMFMIFNFFSDAINIRWKMYLFQSNFKVPLFHFMCVEFRISVIRAFEFSHYVDIGSAAFELDYILLIIYNFDFIFVYSDFF